VTSGEVVGGVFLSGDELLGVEELSVGAGSDFIDRLSVDYGKKSKLGFTVYPSP